MDTLTQAIALFRQGNIDAAKTKCNSQLAMDPGNVDMLSLLAEIQLAAGQNDAVLDSLTRLVALRPHDAAALRRLASAQLAAERATEAEATLRRAIALEPENPRAHNNLGQALMRLGRSGEAISAFVDALRLNPDYPVALNNLGLAYRATGDLDRAVGSFARALSLVPTMAVTDVNLADLLDQKEQYDQALQAYDRALVSDPRLIEAWLGRASTLFKLGRLDSALESLDAALALRVDAPTLVRKASVLLAMERATEALNVSQASVALDEKLATAHNVEAGALRRLSRRADAVAALERAIALDPKDGDAWRNYGTVLHEMGRDEPAIAACRAAIDLEPTAIRASAQLLARLIPSVPESIEVVANARTEFNAHLAEVTTLLSTRDYSESEILAAAQQQLFYLSYDEHSNLGALSSYRGACARRLKSAHPSLADPVSRPTRARGRFRLGIASAHVYDHSVFNAILRGWLRCLDRRRFEISLFSLGTRRDAFTRDAAAHVDEFVDDARPVMQWARTIAARQLDGLIYPELGMNETALALASLRIADRQFVAWGHPETSGLPTIDGYLSAELFEPPEADRHYSERLIRLPNLGVHCEPYRIPDAPSDLGALGIARDAPLLLCPGVPFKYRPQHDEVFVAIARRLGNCRFLFFQHEIPELSAKLRRRVSAAFAAHDMDPERYLTWISWQPRDAFFRLLRRVDVYLDTIGFSGFNTLIQAIECHLPCVTYEGRFMRGRLGSGILKRLGLTELIAHDAKEYVNLVVALAENPGYRGIIREKIRLAESLLYSDVSAVDALGSTLLGEA